MKPTIMEVVEGWSAPLPFTLLSDGTPVDLTGLTVSVVLRNAAGLTVKDTTEGVAVTLTTAGQVQYSPATSSGDLFTVTASPFTVRWRARDAGGKVAYWPNDDEDLIGVNPV